MAFLIVGTTTIVKSLKRVLLNVWLPFSCETLWVSIKFHRTEVELRLYYRQHVGIKKSRFVTCNEYFTSQATWMSSMSGRSTLNTQRLFNSSHTSRRTLERYRYHFTKQPQNSLNFGYHLNGILLLHRTLCSSKRVIEEIELNQCEFKSQWEREIILSWISSISSQLICSNVLLGKKIRQKVKKK